MVELQLPKLLAWVRFPSPAPIHGRPARAAVPFVRHASRCAKAVDDGTHATIARMPQPIPLDVPRLRHECQRCSLRELCLPAGITPEAVQQLDDIVRRRRPLARGDHLFRVGDPLRAVYVARDGAFKTVVVSEDGEEQVIGFHLPGELVGLDALGSGSHRCDAVALDGSNVCEVPFEELASVAARVPGLQAQLLRVIGRGVERDQDHFELLLRRQAGERIAMFVNGLAARYGQIGQSVACIRLPMSRDDIARYLGLALETVSRAFGRLQDDGVIAVHGRQVEIVDPVRLERLAHGTSAAPDPVRPKLAGNRAR